MMFGQPTMQLEVLRELKSLPLDDPQHAPWVDILADVRYLIEQVPDLSPEEQAIMTELRQRWEMEKTELRSAARAEGLAAGMARGKAEGKAEGILTMMRARGLPVSDSVRTRVLSCNDLGLLDRWLVRAATAASDSDVLSA